MLKPVAAVVALSLATTLALAQAAPAAPAAPAQPAAPAEVAQPQPAKEDAMAKVKTFFMAQDATGEPRFKRWLVAAGGLTAMAVGIGTLAVVGTTIAVAPTCIAVGAENCRNNFTKMVQTIPAAANPGNQNVPQPN